MAYCRHIAIVGGSGSGKTWLANKLCAELGKRAMRLSLDDFYRDLSPLPMVERERVNFDDPASVDWGVVLGVMDALTRGEAAQVPVYDFATHTRRQQTRTLAPRPLVFWDGLWLLCDKTMRERFDYAVYMDCAEPERFARRMTRDILERGRTEKSVRDQFVGHVQPMHAKFVEPQRALADTVLASPANPGRVAELKVFLLNLADAR
jgi:uridine kinase